MADIKQSALELIGNTPILQLNRYSEKAGIKDVTILAKLEYLNPAGSVKDRIASKRADFLAHFYRQLLFKGNKFLIRQCSELRLAETSA